MDVRRTDGRTDGLFGCCGLRACACVCVCVYAFADFRSDLLSGVVAWLLACLLVGCWLVQNGCVVDCVVELRGLGCVVGLRG